MENYSQTFSSIRTCSPEQFKNTREKSQEITGWLKQKPAGSRAQKGKCRKAQQGAQLRCSMSLSFAAQSAQIALGMSSDDARKLCRQIEPRFRVECRIERADKLALSAQFTSARLTLCDMRFEPLERIAVQFAIEIRGDIFTWTNVFFRLDQAFVIPLCASRALIASRARNRRFFTVPRGSPVTSAISS